MGDEEEGGMEGGEEMFGEMHVHWVRKWVLLGEFVKNDLYKAPNHYVSPITSPKMSKHPTHTSQHEHQIYHPIPTIQHASIHQSHLSALR